MKKTSSTASNASHSVASGIRYDRDKFFDDTIGSPQPLTSENAGRSHISEGAVYGAPPEIPSLNDSSLIIIGRFDSFQSFLSASHRSIYTEIGILVQQVIREAPEKPIDAGGNLIIVIPGGTVDAGAGSILSYLTDNRDYSLQPNHRYLLLLTHERNGDFFTLRQNWDIIDGIVKPNSAYEAERASKGTSQLAGLSVDAAISELKKQLARQ